MNDIDCIFLPKPLKQNSYLSTNRILKKIDLKRSEGLTGKDLSKAAYAIKKIEEELEEQEIGTGYYIKPGVWEKNVIRQHLTDSGLLDRFVKIQHRSQLYLMIQTTQKLVEVANTTNIFGLIFENLREIKEDTRFSPCQLIGSNFAWISQDRKGMYRYFSKREGGNTIGLSIFDLIEIVDGVEIGEKGGFRHAQQELAKLLDLDELRDQWQLEQRNKYQRNLKVLENKDAEFERNYPVLSAYIQKYLPLLEFFNDHVEAKLYRAFCFKDEHIFFVSTTHLKEKLGLEQSKVVRSVNVLTLIGMILKIPHHKLPIRLLQISDQMVAGRKGYKRITYFQVPRYNRDTLAAAEVMVMKLQKSGIWESRISRERVERNFGTEIADQVFLSDYVVQKPVAKEAYQSMESPFFEDAMDDIPF